MFFLAPEHICQIVDLRTRADTTKKKILLETAVMKTLRKIKKTLRDKNRCEENRKICRIENINQWSKNRKVIGTHI